MEKCTLKMQCLCATMDNIAFEMHFNTRTRNVHAQREGNNSRRNNFERAWYGSQRAIHFFIKTLKKSIHCVLDLYMYHSISYVSVERV